MSERPTPETDAACGYASNWDSLQGKLRDEVPAEFARRLERERDEARADRDIARLAAMDSDKAHDRMVGELEKVYKERDEAWACCDELVVDSNAITLAKTVMRLERERDEAREDAANYYAKIGELIEERDLARKEIDRYREKHDLLPISWEL